MSHELNMALLGVIARGNIEEDIKSAVQPFVSKDTDYGDVYFDADNMHVFVVKGDAADYDSQELIDKLHSIDSNLAVDVEDEAAPPNKSQYKKLASFDDWGEDDPDVDPSWPTCPGCGQKTPDLETTLYGTKRCFECARNDNMEWNETHRGGSKNANYDANPGEYVETSEGERGYVVQEVHNASGETTFTVETEAGQGLVLGPSELSGPSADLSPLDPAEATMNLQVLAMGTEWKCDRPGGCGKTFYDEGSEIEAHVSNSDYLDPGTYGDCPNCGGQLSYKDDFFT
jgi:hypothetical protein